MFNNQIIAGSSGQGGSFYETTIDQSLRLNGVDSNLARTHTAGDRQKFTWSGWVKFGNDNIFSVFEAFSNGTNFTQLTLNTSGFIGFYHIASAVDYGGNTTQRLRDPSAWYHIVFRIDTTQASAGDRIRIYVNGTQFETNPFTNYGSIPQNTSTYINTARAHRMGYNQNVGGGGAPATQANAFGNGYLAEVHFCDGQSYAPTEFGETSSGIWVPIAPSVTYGTNGFHLAFSDTSAIGDDTSGEGNDWTVDDIAASDVVSDSPTNNFETWNPVGRMYGTSNSPATSEGNLKAATAGNSTHIVGTFGIEPSDTQGYYWEVKAISIDTARSYLGILAPEGGAGGASVASYGFYKKFVLNRNGNLYGNNDTSSTNVVALTSWTTNDILMFAYKNGKIWIGKNGTWMNSGDPAAGTGDLVAQDGGRPSDRGDVTWFPYAGYNSTYTANFGQEGTFAGTETAGGNSDENGHGDFKYSVPSGFLALCASNLPEPTIGPNSAEQADDNFNIALYQSNGGLNAITGLGHQPDFLWIKQRDSTNSHAFTDSVRGPTKALTSNATSSEYTYSNGLQSFDADGFTLNGNNGWYNSTTVRNYVAWSWKAGTTFSGTTNGSKAYSGSSNADAGFSIITYVGNETAGHQIPHNLDSAPEMVIAKSRGHADQWPVYHKGVASDAETDFLRLNTTAAASDAATVWNDTAPSSTVVTLGSTDDHNKNNIDQIMYCFHSVSGYSSVSKYIGNGNADGVFVYTGFRPAFVLCRRSSSTAGWHMFDNKRPNAYNVINKRLEADNSDAENSTSGCEIDFLSNGFKFRGTFDNINGSGATHIYLAFAEAPFKYANAR